MAIGGRSASCHCVTRVLCKWFATSCCVHAEFPAELRAVGPRRTGSDAGSPQQRTQADRGRVPDLQPGGGRRWLTHGTDDERASRLCRACTQALRVAMMGFVCSHQAMMTAAPSSTPASITCGASAKSSSSKRRRRASSSQTNRCTHTLAS